MRAFVYTYVCHTVVKMHQLFSKKYIYFEPDFRINIQNM